MKIIVRTWHKVRVEGYSEFQDRNFLKTVELPDSAVSRIAQWAKEQQINLLLRKHKKSEKSFRESQLQEHLVTMNKLYKQLQSEGLKSEEERLAIGFLFGQHRDNPELIDLQVASQFLAELEQERQTA